MDVFDIHQRVISDYAEYTQSFIKISDQRISDKVKQEIEDGLLWPEPLLQLNPSFEPGCSIEELVEQRIIHEGCGQIFRIKSNHDEFGKTLRLHRHQEQAIHTYLRNEPYVLTTGTGSGKSLSYIIPAVDHVLKNGSGKGIQAIIVYPMNALANSQREELDKFLKLGFKSTETSVSYARYTGQESSEERERILKNPPDILLTNYVMLELILTRVGERALVRSASNLRFLVFDELHTYRGRQGADVAMLIRRCRDAFGSDQMRCVGTSATMASKGTTDDQTKVVAQVASMIFGEQVSESNIIGESLKRTTQEFDFDSNHKDELIQELTTAQPFDFGFDDFVESRLASWLETNIGLQREPETQKLIRQIPLPIRGKDGVAAKLAKLTGVSDESAREKIKEFLLAGSRCKNPSTGFPVFAFRLHQFITRGDTAWATLEPESERVITLRGQQYVPGDRTKILLPLVFCRSCGHPYYRVDVHKHMEDGFPIQPREDFKTAVNENLESGYLYLSTEDPWPDDLEEQIGRVPPDWTEEHRGQLRIKKSQRVPQLLRVGTGGTPDQQGIEVAFVPAPFRFCLNPSCKVAYNARQRSDVPKLSTIGIDGRSTATTILALSTILKLRLEGGLPDKARKLLSFTDNRQDASLQAGHFNDFVEMSLLRSALYRAMCRIGSTGLNYDDLVIHAEKSMDLPMHLYSKEELRGPALEETRRALRSVVRYFLYRDLERDWRVTSPNLEQCGLLKIEYRGIDECVEDQQFWDEKNAHPLIRLATPQRRKRIIIALLDHLRRSLAIKEDALNPTDQEKISEQSKQRLREPWVIENPRDMTQAAVAWPRSRAQADRGYGDVYISPQSNFGQFLNRLATEQGDRLSLEERGELILDLFRCIRIWGLVEEVRTPVPGSQIAGYQVPSSMFIWMPGDGSEVMVDELRVTQQSQQENIGNEYFIELYKSFADIGTGLEAREHTAQVQSDVRQEREDRFREADLPLMFCSPTMELGVDISQLNVVNMRNVPPTPANYAQRSGRAGRGGQPAFVYTYCSGFSPHDQFYFKNPSRMVAGAVTAPRIDLFNRDLIQSHIHAIWLAEADVDLGKTLSEGVLVVNEDDLSLPLKEEIVDKIHNDAIRLKTLNKARRLISDLKPEIETAGWYREEWLDDVIQRMPQTFDSACERWRSLYKSAVDQRHYHNKIIGDHARKALDRDRSKLLRAQAESQINLLTNPQSVMQGDFYSYRYFASEGFLPGYNFPRLPLSAFIPARRGRQGRDEYLSRPRFLAISEFGPRAAVYHEGARYRINKISLQIDQESSNLTESAMKICSLCGYGHEVNDGVGPDVCESCNQQLDPRDVTRTLIRLQNVTARRADRITSDEEERQRVGYQIQNTYRFAEVNGQTDCRLAEVRYGDALLATLRYGDATTIWRINRGWRQRKNESELGFLLDVERGYWATNSDVEDGDLDDPMTKQIRRVVPFVQDTRNALTLQLDIPRDAEFMATLQAALKQAIQKVFQLESSELAVEPLPDYEDRNLLFFYEASEGGAGVLRQLAEESGAMAEIAREAIAICHYDVATGEDQAPRPDNDIQCEAACYDCLLEYGNQPDHRLIDRKDIIPLLQDLARSETAMSGSGASRVDHFSRLVELCDSQLEKKWLQSVLDQQLRLPTDGQHLIEACSTRPDFFYQEARVAVYIDGPHHDTDDYKTEDTAITNKLIGSGYMVIRFHHADDWNAVFDQFHEVFGKRKG